MGLKVIDSNDIMLSHLNISVEELKSALINTNDKFAKITNKTRLMDLNIFEVLDFRNFSGVIGETFSSELAKINKSLIKNPNQDGYPDLLQVSTTEMLDYYQQCVYRDLIKYKDGGLEIKNTFGTKKGSLLMGDQRIELIKEKLDWKAHHQQTNNLIGLMSDYIDDMPQIVAICYSDQLNPEDWGKVQKPKEGSTMTSFSTIGQTGYKKMVKGIKICIDDPKYLKFFHQEVRVD
ncbi:hypothetical protein SAMN05421670_1812 [Psychrobacillus psychrotolerans]|uniref:Uncharacterized protein n=1 Tax=Psychrobacillus psychrotolerans TaxID=126156 RepID=A0A1I5XZN9_9BACI|nr:hypothetical protein [Psychrobacillus psychrotolerans]SFQ37386.1 hypothetical protein SAMN05421670_1812 [Psychrobacillus psychrotolerans]